MRWRLSGTSWAGDNQQRWQVPPALSLLLTQVDSIYPERHAADGTAAGRGHLLASPKSDHNPDINGDVRAADIGETTENDAFNTAEQIRISKDGRIKYVIHEKRMYSSYWKGGVPPFTWRSYGGSNPHSNHVHISILKSLQDYDNKLWAVGLPANEEEDMKELIEAHQYALNMAGFMGADGQPVKVDGILGPNTQHALNYQAMGAKESLNHTHPVTLGPATPA